MMESLKYNSKIFSCIIFIFLFINVECEETTTRKPKVNINNVVIPNETPSLEMCGPEKEFSIVKTRKLLVRSPKYGSGESYPLKLKCSLYVSGDSGCRVRATCFKFDFRPTECKKEFLKVLNGYEEFRTPAKLCGSNMLREPYLAALDLDEATNNGLRFDVKTSTTTKFKRVYNGFECKASCVEDDFLKEEEEAEEEGEEEETPEIESDTNPEPTTTIQPRPTCPPNIKNTTPIIEVCDGTKEQNISIVETGRVIIQSKNFGTGNNYPNGQKCSVFVHGDKNCQVQAVCKKVDLRAQKCKQEKVQILNGFEEYRVPVDLCGSRLIRNPWLADLDVEDGVPNGLMVQFTTAKNATFKRHYNGFRCNLRCVHLDEFECEEADEVTTPTPPKPTCPPEVIKETPVIEICDGKKQQNVSIVPSGRVIVQSKNFGSGKSYEAGQSCSVFIHGDADCQVQAVCKKVDLRPQLCKKERVDILNGFEEYRTPTDLCGSRLIRDPWLADLDIETGVPNGLMINFKTAKDAKFKRVYNGFRCHLRCVNLDEFDCDEEEIDVTTVRPTKKPKITTTTKKPEITTTTKPTTPTTITTTMKPTKPTTVTTTTKSTILKPTTKPSKPSTTKPTTTTSPKPFVPVTCDLTINVTSKTKDLYVETYMYDSVTRDQYPAGVCYHRFVTWGDDCVPRFACPLTIDLRPNCTEEFVHFSDVLNPDGGMKLCGGERRPFFIYSKTKYLTVTVKTMEGPYDRFYSGFQCQVECKKKLDAQSIQSQRRYRSYEGKKRIIFASPEEQAAEHDLKL